MVWVVITSIIIHTHITNNTNTDMRQRATNINERDETPVLLVISLFKYPNIFPNIATISYKFVQMYKKNREDRYYKMYYLSVLSK